MDLTGVEMAPGLAGGEFVWSWSGLSTGNLFELMRVSMPQDDPASVSRQEKADILAFILFKTDFPAGTTELANRTEMLNPIAFEALQPLVPFQLFRAICCEYVASLGQRPSFALCKTYPLSIGPSSWHGTSGQEEET